VMICNIIRGA